MSDTEIVCVRMVSLLAIILSLVGLHYALWKRWVRLRQMLLIMTWLIMLGLFLTDRIFNELIAQSPIADKYIHAWSVFIRLQTSLSGLAIVILTIYDRKVLRKRNE